MAVYTYTARDATGRQVSGTYADVRNTESLREALGKLGYVVVTAQRQRKPRKTPARIRPREVAAFVYKLGGMYAAGLPVLRCLEALEQQTANCPLREVIADVRRRVETGASLKAAFEPHRKAFSDFFLGMIEAGESAGRLAQVLEMSARYLEKRLDLRDKTRAAFVYPMVVGAVCSLVVLCLLIFVVPMFSQLYRRLHVEVPGPTQALVTMSVALRHWWWLTLALGAGAVLSLRYVLKHPGTQAQWQRWKLKVPLLGPLSRLVAVSQFIRTFGILISVGIPLIEALDVANNVAHNHEISRVTPELQKATRSGQPVAATLSAHPVFPPVVVQLASSGEEAGVLPEMLEKSADLLDKDIDRMTRSLLAKLEPAMTVLMGLLIGLILMGVYLPMFDYMATLK